jgi:hypothetical protein
MTEGNSATKAFTKKLLRIVREQRHQAVKIVIATQEPSINTQLLDLRSITIVHRCTSPASLNVLKKHVAALYLNLLTSSAKARKIGDGIAELPQGDKALFQEIIQLKLSEGLLFCPTATIAIARARIEKIERGYVKFKTWQRVTADRGKSRLAPEAQF